MDFLTRMGGLNDFCRAGGFSLLWPRVYFQCTVGWILFSLFVD